MLMVSKNPTYGPIWFGVMADIVAIVAVIMMIRKRAER